MAAEIVVPRTTLHIPEAQSTRVDLVVVSNPSFAHEGSPSADTVHQGPIQSPYAEGLIVSTGQHALAHLINIDASNRLFTRMNHFQNSCVARVPETHTAVKAPRD